MRKRSAFTLVELLVVLAALAALIGMLFPVYRGVREKGRQARCISNLAQIGKAVVMYAQDHSGYIPPYNNSDALERPRDDALLIQALGPYLRNQEIWRCPSDPHYGEGTVRNADSNFSHRLGSYATNPLTPPVVLYSGPGHTGAYAVTTPWRIDSPGTKRAREPSAYIYLADWFLWEIAETVSHNRRANVLVFDGRVTSLPIPALLRHTPAPRD